MSDKKIVGINTAKKPDEPCLYCGAKPACPGMTCPKVKVFELLDDGVTLGAVEFFPPSVWKPRA